MTLRNVKYWAWRWELLPIFLVNWNVRDCEEKYSSSSSSRGKYHSIELKLKTGSFKSYSPNFTFFFGSYSVALRWWKKAGLKSTQKVLRSYYLMLQEQHKRVKEKKRKKPNKDKVICLLP